MDFIVSNLEMGAGQVSGVRRNPEASLRAFTPSLCSDQTGTVNDKHNLEMGAGDFRGHDGILKLVRCLSSLISRSD